MPICREGICIGDEVPFPSILFNHNPNPSRNHSWRDMPSPRRIHRGCPRDKTTNLRDNGRPVDGEGRAPLRRYSRECGASHHERHQKLRRQHGHPSKTILASQVLVTKKISGVARIGEDRQIDSLVCGIHTARYYCTRNLCE